MPAANPAAVGAVNEFTDASSLLTQEESALRARTLRAWTLEQQSAIGRIFHELRLQWLMDWGLESGDSRAVTVQALPMPAAAGGVAHWLSAPLVDGLHDIAAQWAFFSEEQAMDPVGAIEQALFGATSTYSEATVAAGDSVAIRIARAGWIDWWRRFAAISPPLFVATSPFDDSRYLGTWAGDLQVDIPCLSGRLAMRLSGEYVADLIHYRQIGLSVHRASSTTVKRTVVQAIGDHVLQVRAELEQVELSLGQLQGLQVGDVVRLKHPLNDPVKLSLFNDQPFCLGWLGQHDGHVAVELTAGKLLEKAAS